MFCRDSTNGLDYGERYRPSQARCGRPFHVELHRTKVAREYIFGARPNNPANNKKTGYLRALGCGLMLKDLSALTLNVQKAMAGIATVAINDPDVVVTYDDVRTVFAQRKAIRHCPKES